MSVNYSFSLPPASSQFPLISSFMQNIVPLSTIPVLFICPLTSQRGSVICRALQRLSLSAACALSCCTSAAVSWFLPEHGARTWRMRFPSCFTLRKDPLTGSHAGNICDGWFYCGTFEICESWLVSMCFWTLKVWFSSILAWHFLNIHQHCVRFQQPLLLCESWGGVDECLCHQRHEGRWWNQGGPQHFTEEYELLSHHQNHTVYIHSLCLRKATR